MPPRESEPPLTDNDAPREMDRAAASLPPDPQRFGGRGVIIPGGGVRY